MHSGREKIFAFAMALAHEIIVPIKLVFDDIGRA